MDAKDEDNGANYKWNFHQGGKINVINVASNVAIIEAMYKSAFKEFPKNSNDAKAKNKPRCNDKKFALDCRKCNNNYSMKENQVSL